MNDLLSQLNQLIADAEANQAAAGNWRQLVVAIGEIGYGPRITPQQIADLLPNITILAEIAASTQEVAAPEAAKRVMPRRKLNDDDKRTINMLAGQEYGTQKIAQELGVARNAVIAHLGHE